MREATGDLNLTVIVVIAVAGLMAFFSITLWPMIKSGMKNDENCSDAYCNSTPNRDGMVECWRKDPQTGTSGSSFMCPFKG